MKGLSQPVLGVFSICISEFIKVGRERNARKLRKASQALLNKTMGTGGLNLFMQKAVTGGPTDPSKPQAGGLGALQGGGLGLGALGVKPAEPKLGGLGLGGLGQTGSTEPKLGGLGLGVAGSTEPKLGALGGSTQPKLGALGGLGGLGVTKGSESKEEEEEKSGLGGENLGVDGKPKAGYVGLHEENLNLEKKKDPMTISLEVKLLYNNKKKKKLGNCY